MEGKSHKVGGVLAGLVGFYALRDHNLLIEGVDPLIQLSIMYPFAIVGSLLPDQDHHENSAPMKDAVSMAFCKLIHLTHNLRKQLKKGGMSVKSPWYRLLGIFDAKHRSWQTHSDLSFILTLMSLLWIFQSVGGEATTNGIIFRLIATGLVLGIISHLVLDMLTPSGVWCLVSVLLNSLLSTNVFPEKIRLVPKNKFFATGGKWEEWWRYAMGVVSSLMFLYLVIEQLPWQINLYF